eukprot:1017757-Amphidinium_carterae.1
MTATTPTEELRTIVHRLQASCASCRPPADTLIAGQNLHRIMQAIQDHDQLSAENAALHNLVQKIILLLQTLRLSLIHI